MSATYIHTQRKAGFSQIVIRFLAILYFIALAASIVYLWLFTQDRFISTAEFKISQQDASGVTTGLVQLALPGLSDSGSLDSQVAIGYINSADLLLELEKNFDLVKHYTSPKTDYFFRLKSNANLEERLEYYRNRILAHYDKDTGMTIITVDTFNPELSKKIATKLLKNAEEFINVINQQIAEQQLSFVNSEMERTATRVEELNKELITLQNEHNFINPDEVISASLQAVQEMKLDLLRSETEMSSIQRDSPNSPRLETLRSHIRSVNELIDIESAKLSGPEKDRMNQLLLQFKQLALKIDFATRLRTGAETMLEKNRVDAVARSKFFTVIQTPYLPEDIAIPRRPYATVAIIILGLMLFLILRALTHSIFERA
ncbi:MAG: hypothetical protein ABIS50_18825 [Luteolibacter sp.]|uniref:hypothetical protein n=1 Tax=Luteolibacter sp. TaxID=1962973 RepID=UPI0032664E7F